MMRETVIRWIRGRQGDFPTTVCGYSACDCAQHAMSVQVLHTKSVCETQTPSEIDLRRGTVHSITSADFPTPSPSVCVGLTAAR